jgi:hypothetical protein
MAGEDSKDMNQDFCSFVPCTCGPLLRLGYLAAHLHSVESLPVINDLALGAYQHSSSISYVLFHNMPVD